MFYLEDRSDPSHREPMPSQQTRAPPRLAPAPRRPNQDPARGRHLARRFQVTHTPRARTPSTPRAQSATIGCWVPESEIAELLSKTERAFDGCQIGSYPFFREGRVGANFVIRSTDTAQLEACAAALISGLEATGREAVAGGI